MNTRIAQILHKKSLSNKAFAELLGIQRSGVSHLLSGRNKPSIDFIIKLVKQFPEINMEWLILGKGEMCRDLPPTSSFETKVQTESPSKASKEFIPPTVMGAEIEKIILLMKDGSFRVFQ